MRGYHQRRIRNEFSLYVMYTVWDDKFSFNHHYVQHTKTRQTGLSSHYHRSTNNKYQITIMIVLRCYRTALKIEHTEMIITNEIVLNRIKGRREFWRTMKFRRNKTMRYLPSNDSLTKNFVEGHTGRRMPRKNHMK